MMILSSLARRAVSRGASQLPALRCQSHRTPLLSTVNTTTRFFGSSSSRNDNNNNKTGSKAADTTTTTTATVSTTGDDNALFERTVYVHPLSQIVLEYLQEAHHDWIVSQHLDTALTLHRDGSFELKFPKQEKDSDGKDDAPAAQQHHYHNYDRIWTYYDEVEKKHWLSVSRRITGTNTHDDDNHNSNYVQERFLLQDNLLPAWNNNRKSLPERIHLGVDQMIHNMNITSSTSSAKNTNTR